MIHWLRDWLAHPLTRGLDLDDPRTTQLRRQVIRGNPFLQRIYHEWYQFMAQSLPPVSGPVLELGSGAGFLKEFIPDLITSDVMALPGLSLALDAQRLPFADQSLRAIAMTNVLHHFASLKRFFAEAARCLKPGGRILLIEPWVSWWSCRVYRLFHHEPLDVTAREWTLPASGPLSGANMALPWIAFSRDRAQFEQAFPTLKILAVHPMLPLCYLVSGGVSMRPLMPGWSFRLWRSLESCLQPWIDRWGMFAQIIVEQVGGPHGQTECFDRSPAGGRAGSADSIRVTQT